MLKLRLPKLLLALPVVLTLVSTANLSTSQADMIFTGSSGSQSASADFNLSGSTLTVTLTNTSSADVLLPTDVLTGLFFNTVHTLTPDSASLNGSSVVYGSLTNVGNGWGYASGVSAHGENSAISASGAVAGLGHSNFSVAHNSLGGLDYGILSAGDNTGTGNSGVTAHGPLIKDSVQFTLTAGSGFSLSELGNSVVFQYGTSLTETSIPGGPNPNPRGEQVPVPNSMVMLGLLGCIGLVYRRRLKAAVLPACC